MQAKESSRKEARDALRASELAISDLNRTLRELDARGRDATARLQELDRQRRGAGEVLARRQAALGRVLAAKHLERAPDVLRLVLSGDDPNEAARQLHYLSVVSSATAKVIADYRASLAELESLQRATAEQSAGLAQIEQTRRTDRERLLAERRERQRVLERIAGDLRRGRQQMRQLQADEARLARVVREISRVLTARPGAGHRPPVAGDGGARAASPGVAAAPFSRQRGRLRLPVRGELIGRFGTQYGGASAARKGIFIRSAEGEPVRAVAAGRVVYADWMRGFGNLLIVDHGESYLSVYGNNESLLRAPGDAVAAGDPVATVGATGGNEQTGLYFELRHLGEAFDPLRWMRR
ncbi:MAG: murein hydrolase activator EnvC [Burkholderiales bacterium]